jgi:penicillin-binding protein 2
LASTSYRPKLRTFLPGDPRVEEPYRLTPQLAFRIGILGAFALAAFALLFLRLWALQVLSGDDYLRAARDNQLRQVRVEAARGQIVDRRGRLLVDNRTVTSIRIWPSNLPDRGRYREMRRLAHVLGVPLSDVLAKLQQQKLDPLTPITIKNNVPPDVITFLSERQTDFPGVKIEETQVRRYPWGDLASQTLGNVGEVTEQQLKTLKGYHLGDRIGQRGVESAFDRFLRGKDGLAQARFDSAGHPRSDLQITAAPTAGDTVRLTLDAKLQKAAENAILYGENLAAQNHNYFSRGGAAVAINPQNGDVLALASEPGFQPGAFVNPNMRKQLNRLLSSNPSVAAADNYPMVNRAIAGLYPPGSTFKPVTALAAMEEGLLSPYSTIDCPASWTVPLKDPVTGKPITGGTFNNWNHTASGPLTLPQALEQSCDTYFYQLGYDFYLQPGNRHPLQEWAARWGFGRPTGIDIGGEYPGLLPTPEWRDRTYTAKTDPTAWQVDRLWKPGDSVQLAIGQKDLTVTPLQLARFYAMIANGGKIVRPHLLDQVEEPGTSRTGPLVLRRYSSPPPVDSRIDPSMLDAVQAGLYGATHGGQGTASAVFSTFPTPISGKTGTAQKAVPGLGLQDQSWFCGYGPSTSGAVPTIALCVVIENGGFGAEAAAPAALKIFREYFHEGGGAIVSQRND